MKQLHRQVYLGLGANLGEAPVAALGSALKELEPVFDGFEVSSFYRTLPRDDPDQPTFINAVVGGRTLLPPLEVLRFIQNIELDFGRVRDPRRPKGPRVIDIDILLFGDEIIDIPMLSVPHPRMTERKFVLVPLLELDSALQEPGSGRFYADYAADLEAQGIYFLTMNDYSRSLSWEG